jgi:hypothetical protein
MNSFVTADMTTAVEVYVDVSRTGASTNADMRLNRLLLDNESTYTRDHARPHRQEADHDMNRKGPSTRHAYLSEHHPEGVRDLELCEDRGMLVEMCPCSDRNAHMTHKPVDVVTNRMMTCPDIQKVVLHDTSNLSCQSRDVAFRSRIISQWP